jgi:hypothetical protein
VALRSLPRRRPRAFSAPPTFNGATDDPNANPSTRASPRDHEMAPGNGFTYRDEPTKPGSITSTSRAPATYERASHDPDANRGTRETARQDERVREKGYTYRDESSIPESVARTPTAPCAHCGAPTPPRPVPPVSRQPIDTQRTQAIPRPRDGPRDEEWPVRTFEGIPARMPAADPYARTTTQQHPPTQTLTRSDKTMTTRTDTAIQTEPPPPPPPEPHQFATAHEFVHAHDAYRTAYPHAHPATPPSDDDTTESDSTAGSETTGESEMGESETGETRAHELRAGQERRAKEWVEDEAAKQHRTAIPTPTPTPTPMTIPTPFPRNLTSLRTDEGHPWRSLRRRTHRAATPRPRPFPHCTQPLDMHHCHATSQPTHCHVVYMCCHHQPMDRSEEIRRKYV